MVKVEKHPSARLVDLLLLKPFSKEFFTRPVRLVSIFWLLADPCLAPASIIRTQTVNRTLKHAAANFLLID